MSRATDQILEALGFFGPEEDRAPRSGAEISEQLGVSRTQIWKHVEQLRARGYVIEGAPGGGYALSALPDRLYPELLRSRLATRAIGQRVEHCDRTDSTNRIASELARGGAPHGTAVIAEEQTAGRGRLGRSFFSPPYLNLYTSIVLRLPLTTESAPSIVLSCAIAVAEAVADEVGSGHTVSVKWPNDVLLDGMKTSGILMEMHAEGARIQSIILGIGINLNVDRNIFPEEFRAGATSLSSSLGRPVARLPFTCRLFERLEEVLDIHAERGFDALRSRFDRLFHMTGHAVDVQEIGAARYAGTVLGIDADGALRLQCKDGRLCRVLAGDVTLSATDPSSTSSTSSPR